jgi:hypothetical protein
LLLGPASFNVIDNFLDLLRKKIWADADSTEKSLPLESVRMGLIFWV